MPETVFETGAIFVLKDDFSANLAKLATGLGDADKKLMALIDKATGLGPAFAKAADMALGSITRLQADVDVKAASIDKTVSGAFSGLGASASNATKVALDSLASFEKATLDGFAEIKLASNDVFAGLGTSATAGATETTAAFGRIDAAIAGTKGGVGSLKAELDRLGSGVKLPTNALQVPGLSSGFGEDAHLRDRHGSLHNARAVFRGGTKGFEAASALLPFEVNPMTAGLAVGAAGVYEAVEQQHKAALALMGGNLDAKSLGLTNDTLVEAIKKGASATGDSFDAVAEAYAAGSRILQGVAPDTRLKLIGDLLKPAEYESQLKGVGLGESMKAMLELAHQTGTYDTAAIQKMASQFSIASLNSNDGLDALTRQSAYFLPQLHAAVGMDFGSGIALEVAAQNAGLTRAGTSVKNFGENIFSKTGKGSQAHNDALRDLGLIGADDKPLWQVFGKDGATDWTASELNIGKMIGKALEGKDDTFRMDTFHHAFGEQGGRIAALLSTEAFRDQVTGIKSRIDTFGSDGDLLKQLKAVDPMQQFRESWTDLKNVLGDIGDLILPPLNLALHGLDDGLKGLHATFDLFSGIMAHGDPANRPKTLEEKSRELNPAIHNPMIHKSAFTSFADDAIGMAAGGPLTDAIADGFLKAFRQIQGIDIGSVTAPSGFTNAAFYGTGGTGSASGGGTGASPGGSTIVMTGAGDAVDAALKLQGFGSSGAAAALGAHMTNGEWCADFVNGALATHGIKGSGSSAALSFSRWGQPIDLAHAAKGDVAFENHGGGHGHAMLLTGEHDKRGYLGVIAGNSGGGRVEHYFENPNKLAGIRRAFPMSAFSAKPPAYAAAPPPRHSASHPSDKAGPIEIVLHSHHYLDGREIKHEVVRRIVADARYGRSVGGRDSHGSWVAPGDTLTDAG